VIYLPVAHADASYVIPLEGGRWVSNVIPVHVSGGTVWQQNQALQAMKLWNQAQLWFNDKYFPNSSGYTFEPGDASAPVQVTMLNSSIIIEGVLGWTDYRLENGIIKSAKVGIAAAYPEQVVLVLSAHELGHVLGLGDDVLCCKKDLMNASPIVHNVSAIPTTLDLYALHVLATVSTVPRFVWLANQIPYQSAVMSPSLINDFDSCYDGISARSERTASD